MTCSSVSIKSSTSQCRNTTNWLLGSSVAGTVISAVKRNVEHESMKLCETVHTQYLSSYTPASAQNHSLRCHGTCLCLASLDRLQFGSSKQLKE